MKIEFREAYANSNNTLTIGFYHSDYDTSTLTVRVVDDKLVVDDDCQCIARRITKNVKLTIETCSNGYIVKGKETFIADSLYNLQEHIRKTVEFDDNVVIPLSEFDYDPDQLQSVLDRIEL